jgi:hypothetical protein
MNERMKMVLERTEKTLCRHLEDLNDQVEQDGGRIKDNMVLDGIKDSVKTLYRIKELMDHSNGETVASKMAAKTMPGIV